MALVNRGAAIIVKEADAKEQLVPVALNLLHDKNKQDELKQHILRLAQKDSAARIAQEARGLIKR